MLLLIILAVTLTGCNRKIPTNEHILMLTVQSKDWGEVNADEDYYVGSTWDVYYDGQVEFEDEYNLTGMTDQDIWELDQTKFEELYKLLTGKFERYDEDYESACDGVGWKFYFYDEDGNLNHEFRGYIYENETMQEIVEIIESSN